MSYLPYSQGTFTPTMVGTVTGTTTYSVQSGFYVRIGNKVTVWADIVYSAATGTGNMILGGLPFTIKNQANYIPQGVCRVDSAGTAWPTGTTDCQIAGLLNTTTANISCSGTSHAAALMQVSNTTAAINYCMTYEI